MGDTTPPATGGQDELFVAVTFRHIDGVRAIDTVHGPFDEAGRRAAVKDLRNYRAPEDIETHKIHTGTEVFHLLRRADA